MGCCPHFPGKEKQHRMRENSLASSNKWLSWGSPMPPVPISSRARGSDHMAQRRCLWSRRDSVGHPFPEGGAFLPLLSRLFFFFKQGCLTHFSSGYCPQSCQLSWGCVISLQSLLRAMLTWPKWVYAPGQRTLHILMAQSPLMGRGRAGSCLVTLSPLTRLCCFIWGQPSELHRECHYLYVLDSGDGPRHVGSSLTLLNPQGRKQERAEFNIDFLLQFNE